MSRDCEGKLEQAKEMLERGGFTCVAVTRSGEALTSTQRGVRPLLNWIDDGIGLHGAVVADKVVGDGAAKLYVCLGVAAVYGAVMSEPAQATLLAHGIAAFAGELVERIVNRTGDGFCPMELAVAGIEDPLEAEQAIRARLAQMAGD